MEIIKYNLNSHLTAKERFYLSFPSRILMEKGLLNGNILDYGCGYGKDVELLKEKGLNIIGYDPYYFPIKIENKFDTILCLYVLNVLQPEEQSQVLMDVAHLLKPTGKAFFAVRRDIKFEGFRLHKIHKEQTYQCSVRLPFRSIFQNENVEIYEYQHYTVLNSGNNKVSPFFVSKTPKNLISESAQTFSIYDGFPVSKGHSLIIPKRLVSNYFDLPAKEQYSCVLMINKVKTILQKEFNPDGFNVGININEAAGQTVKHAHIHLIPRYKGDIENPRGGVRGVIPNKRIY
ncbi:hypothetical protein MASR1M45_02570 [Candidatus Kapaibacterium sp.]